MGYKQAGFDVTGIDVEPQPKYPFKFILSDAITYLKEHGKEYDFIHASPPCQGYSHLTPKEHKGNYEKLIDVLRELLIMSRVTGLVPEDLDCLHFDDYQQLQSVFR